MKLDILNDFSLHSAVSEEHTDKYKNYIPPQLMGIWKNYGFGSFYGGYLKIIDPDEWMQVLRDSYFRSDISVPVMATAFGDIITWESNVRVGIVRYRYGDFNAMIDDFDLFLMLLNDDGFKRRFFDLGKYDLAVQKCGKLEYDECFGYVPLLALGGSEETEHIQKVKMKEHIYLITELVGGI